MRISAVQTGVSIADPDANLHCLEQHIATEVSHGSRLIVFPECFVSGYCFSSTGKDTAYFPYEQRPVYPGGTAELSKYVSNAVKYPADARRKEIQGRVMVQFSVNEEGKLGDFKVTQKVEPMLDEEAVRVIKNMPEWQPGKIDGKPAKFLYALPVIFMLN